MRRLLLLSIIPWLLAADDHWVKFTRGPLEVMTDAGARVGRETDRKSTRLNSSH